MTRRAAARVGERAGAVRQAHGWLLEVAHLLEPGDPPRAGATVRQQVEAALGQIAAAAETGPEWLRPAVDHLVTVLRRLGDGLYHCYDVPGLPRTDNALEQFYRRVKSGERRITGRKRAGAFVVRVGGFAVYAVAAAGEAEAELVQRLATVAADDWRRERATLWANQERQRKMRRFALHRAAYLADLEARWTELAASP